MSSNATGKRNHTLGALIRCIIVEDGVLIDGNDIEKIIDIYERIIQTIQCVFHLFKPFCALQIFRVVINTVLLLVTNPFYHRSGIAQHIEGVSELPPSSIIHSIPPIKAMKAI